MGKSEVTFVVSVWCVRVQTNWVVTRDKKRDEVRNRKFLLRFLCVGALKINEESCCICISSL